MKLRHAAALALAAWYLMVPPMNRSWRTDLLHRINPKVPIIDKCNPNAPLGEWEVFWTYDRAEDCQAKIPRVPQEVETVLKSLDSFEGHPALKMTVEEREEIDCAYRARCIATDDPRLAK